MRKTLLTLCLAASVTGGFAATLTPAEALERALGDTPAKVADLGRSSSYILDWEGPRGGLYLFGNRAGGFIVASGDDTYPALIGYSDAPFDRNRVSPSMQHFLQALDAQIASGVEREKAPAKERAAITPMVKALWNQSEPFNGKTPESNGEHTLTGCIATAMGEIMDYWQYPASGKGEVSYKWENTSKTLSYNFDEHPFDWENILDVYGDDATAAEKDAVAELMLACGMGSKMNYSTTFSGASDTDAAIALTEYFGYDQGLTAEYRDFYRIGVWTDMLYNELAAGRPILYCGFSSAGGHAFVCDGYQYDAGEDYFHINWGWSGEGNGYFLINLLNPSYIGLGASATGFNTMQSALLGLYPAGETPTPRPGPKVLCFGYFATEKFDYNAGETILFGIAGGAMRAGFYNMSLYPVDVVSGISLTDQATGEVTYLEGSVSTTLKPAYGVETYKVNMKDAKPGLYRVHPAFKVDGTWMDLPEEVGMRTKMMMTITDSKITIETTDDSSSVMVTSFGVESLVINTDRPFSMVADVESFDCDEYAQITPVLLSSSYYLVATAESKTVKVADGETVELSWDAVFDPLPEPGAYKLALLSEKSMLMTNPVDVVVVNDATVPETSLTNVRINKRMASTTKPSALKGTELNFSYTFNCVTGWFDGVIYAAVTSGDDQLLKSEPEEIYMIQGQNFTGNCKFDVSEFDPETTYEVRLFEMLDGGNRQIGDAYLFTVPEGAGVAGVAEDEADAEYFSADGTAYGKSVNTPGIYIRRQGGKTTKILKY